ncbi:hypothetical protein CPC16_002051 [Podila verticillata]|nr:hypothetical protein CPC16_002051 [Podila verticillata]
MKFITAILVAAVAAVASAQKIQFNNPTTVTKWTAGKTVFVGWTGNCANSGAAGKNTTVNIVFGDPSAVQFKAILGLIDCTGSLVRADLTAKTSPISYSPAFTILGADGTGPAPSTSASTPAPGTTDAPKSAGTSLTASSAMLAVAGVVAAALTL